MTICGKSLEEHDENRRKFLKAAEAWNLSINIEKSTPVTKEMKTLGYLISHGKLKPDPDRLQGLRDLKTPENKKELERLQGLFAYYAKWVPDFSKRISSLKDTHS